jgi:hypothetical protein
MTTTIPGHAHLESTTLAAAAYHDGCGQLQLDFRDGTRYVYSGVGPDLYRGLLSAVSKDLSLILKTAVRMGHRRADQGFR